MTFDIKMGIPEMERFWEELTNKIENSTASKDEIALYDKLRKAFSLLSENPRHPSLNSHEISQLTDRCGQKVFESYLENNTPGAFRIFWVYYPNQAITIVGLEPHPNNKSNAYKKIKLSSTH